MTTVLSVVMAVLAGVALLLVAVPPRGRGPHASFRVGPLWSWCPDERALTPHLTDHGARRCLSCKTVTKERTHA